VSTAPPGWSEAMAAVRTRHPQVRLELGQPQPGRPIVRLSLIETVGERGAGLADLALTDLCRTADAWGVTLTLTPTPHGRGVSRPRLIRWYRRHAFAGRRRSDFMITDTMLRRPFR
jgi:hypothetical protein